MYSEPKDAGTTERVKYVTTILVSFMINQGCISFFGEIKNKTKQNRKAPKSLKNSRHRKRQKANKGCRLTEVKKQRIHAPLTHLMSWKLLPENVF